MVLFFNEFQDVLKVDETNKIRAAIRSVAQHSKHVSYIFSGSSRKMLNKIFDEKNQPLYMLCNKIILNRINEIHFSARIQKATKRQWHSQLPDEVISAILTISELHPYYVNLLCDKLWDYSKKPTVSNVNHGWEEALVENRGKIIPDLEPLNTNRMKVVYHHGPFERCQRPQQ
ncbi:ATP-binding protein [Coxiella endosymbiont of Ornithodoros maritimus]|uniref:hypothetical protein n=1 Tax=Coxiella endosymbiont of Ornithodoros maritimus TaxID=1656172 RepID=UPI0022656218|nr:hypothetical protein [Coxiella endosymbiont of Ornithodoros maritimus]